MTGPFFIGSNIAWQDTAEGVKRQILAVGTDLMLVSKPLAEHVQWGLVDRNARKGKLPSDHAPMVIDFAV